MAETQTATELFILEKFDGAGIRVTHGYTEDRQVAQEFMRSFMYEPPVNWPWDGIGAVKISRATPDRVLQEVFMGDRDKCPDDIVAACKGD